MTHTNGADAAIQAAVHALSASAASVAQDVVIQVAPELPGDAVAALCADQAIDLIVLDASALRTSTSILLQRRPQQFLLPRWPPHVPACCVSQVRTSP